MLKGPFRDPQSHPPSSIFLHKAIFEYSDVKYFSQIHLFSEVPGRSNRSNCRFKYVVVMAYVTTR